MKGWTLVEWIWFGFCLLVVGLTVGLWDTKASCDTRGCYGGMCMTSAACVPGCACIGGRCS